MSELLSRNFQSLILSSMLQDPRLLHDARACLSEDSFNDVSERKLASSILHHFDKYGTGLSEPVAREYLRDQDVDVEEADQLFDTLRELKPDVRWVRDKLVDHWQARNIQQSLEQAAEMLGQNEPVAEVRRVLMTTITTGIKDEKPGSFWDDNIKERLAMYRDQANDSGTAGRVPTGIAVLDESMFGGLGPGEEGVVLARPNGGKSTALINFGRNAVRHGFRVAHFSFEMGENAVTRRYDMSISGMTRTGLTKTQKTAYERLSSEASRVNYKRLLVKEYPTSSASVAMIDAYLNTVATRDNFTPDVIIVDYAQLIAPTSRYDQLRHELAATHRQLRSIAGERRVPLWTAHQTNRSGLEHELLGMADLAECFEVNAIADVIIGLNQTQREALDKTMRVNIIKNREGIVGVHTPVTVDFSTCTFADILS